MQKHSVDLPVGYLGGLEKEIEAIISSGGDKEKAKRLLHELENTSGREFPELHKTLDS